MNRANCKICYNAWERHQRNVSTGVDEPIAAPARPASGGGARGNAASISRTPNSENTSVLMTWHILEAPPPTTEKLLVSLKKPQSIAPYFNMVYSITRAGAVADTVANSARVAAALGVAADAVVAFPGGSSFFRDGEISPLVYAAHDEEGGGHGGSGGGDDEEQEELFGVHMISVAQAKAACDLSRSLLEREAVVELLSIERTKSTGSDGGGRGDSKQPQHAQRGGLRQGDLRQVFCLYHGETGHLPLPVSSDSVSSTGSSASSEPSSSRSLSSSSRDDGMMGMMGTGDARTIEGRRFGSSDRWTLFESQSDAARALNLDINSVALNLDKSRTGGWEFRNVVLPPGVPGRFTSIDDAPHPDAHPVALTAYRTCEAKFAHDWDRVQHIKQGSQLIHQIDRAEEILRQGWGEVGSKWGTWDANGARFTADGSGGSGGRQAGQQKSGTARREYGRAGGAPRVGSGGSRGSSGRVARPARGGGGGRRSSGTSTYGVEAARRGVSQA